LGKFSPGHVVEIPIAPSGRTLPPLDASFQKAVAVERDKLLQFRVDLCRLKKSVEGAENSSPGPAGAFAGGLCIDFGDAPELQKHLGFLTESESDWSEVRAGDPRMVLIKVLLARCHEQGRDEIHVAEIAADVNATLDAEGATSLSARLVGSLLKSVGLV